MRDKRRQLDFTRHCLFNHARQFRATLDATERRAQPLAPRHQLEWTRADFLTCTGDADDHRLTPTAMRTFERCTHDVDVTDAFKTMVHTPTRHANDDFLDRLVVVFRIHAIRCTKFLRHCKFIGIRIDRDDASGLRLLCTLNDRESNATQTKDCNAVAFLHLRRVMHGTDARRHATAQQANLFGIGVGIDFGQ